MRKIIPLKRQILIEQELEFLTEALTPEEMINFAKTFDQMDGIIGNAKLPHLKQVLNTARNQVASLQREPGFLKQLFSAGLAGKYDKAKTMANLIALQTALVQLFRMLPNIAKLSFASQGNVASETISKKLNLMIEKAPSGERYNVGSLAAKLGVKNDDIIKAAAELGTPFKNKNRTNPVSPDLAQLITAKLKPSVQAQQEPASEQPQATTAAPQKIDKSLRAAIGNEASDRFVQHLNTLSKPTKGILKDLVFGKEIFGFNAEEIAEDFLSMSAKQFIDLANKSARTKFQVAIPAKDVQSIATAQKNTTQQTRAQQTISKKDLINAIQKQLFASKKNVDPNTIRDIIKTLPSGIKIDD